MKKNITLTIAVIICAAAFFGCRLERSNPYDPSSVSYVADTVIPMLESFSISAGAKDVQLDASLTAVFSEAMDTDSVESAFSLASGSSVSGSFEWTEDEKTVTYTPDLDFKLCSAYAVSIGAAAADIHGNGISAFSSSFMTRGPLGVLDTAFGTGGLTEFDDSEVQAVGNAAVIDAEGRILVTGRYDQDMCIWRYNTDGSLDTTFNSQGWTTYHTVVGDFTLFEGYGITLDDGGRIFVTGYSQDDQGYSDMTVWRYTDEGVPYGFSAPGNKPITFNAGRSYADDEGRAIIVDGSGDIYVAGTSVDSTDYPVMALWCYNSDGSAKTSFGNNGIVTPSEADTVEDITYGRAADLALDSQGRIVIAGHYEFDDVIEPAGHKSHIVIRRYNPDGSRDLTFSDDGWLTSYGVAGGTDRDGAWGLCVDESDNIYVTGSIDRNNSSKDEDLIVMKIKENGDWDSSFNSSGFVTVGNADGLSGDNSGLDIKIDNSGKILVAGLSQYYGSNPDTRLSIVRFDADGSLDTGFNNLGWVIFGSMGTANPYTFRAELLFDADNKIIVAGTDSYDMNIWRYE